MYDLICDVISCCVRSCDLGRINVYDKIIIETRKKENKEIKAIVYKNLHLTDSLGMEFTAC